MQWHFEQDNGVDTIMFLMRIEIVIYHSSKAWQMKWFVCTFWTYQNSSPIWFMPRERFTSVCHYWCIISFNRNSCTIVKKLGILFFCCCFCFLFVCLFFFSGQNARDEAENGNIKRWKHKNVLEWLSDRWDNAEKSKQIYIRYLYF